MRDQEILAILCEIVELRSYDSGMLSNEQIEQLIEKDLIRIDLAWNISLSPKGQKIYDAVYAIFMEKFNEKATT